MESKSLEDRIEETRDKLSAVMEEIKEYNEGKLSGKGFLPEVYESNLEERKNLEIELNYYQNQMMIEKAEILIEQAQDLKEIYGEVFEYLKENKK